MEKNKKIENGGNIMRRKPMLLSKLTGEGKVKIHEVIGLIGTRGGTGVTYTGMMLAFYLGNELGKETAFIECSNHGDLELIQKAYEWSCENSAYFRFRNIVFYKNMSSERIADILGDNYEYVIIDFGCELADNLKEFQRCSMKAVVAGRSEWDILKLFSFISRYGVIHGSDTWYYLIPQADDKTLKRLKSETHCRIRGVPFTEEPSRPNRSTKQFFEELLRPI